MGCASSAPADRAPRACRHYDARDPHQGAPSGPSPQPVSAALPPASPRLTAVEIDRVANANPFFAALEADAEGDCNAQSSSSSRGVRGTEDYRSPSTHQFVTSSTAGRKNVRPTQPPAAAEAAGARFTCPAAYLDDAEPRSDDDGDAEMDPAQVLFGFLDEPASAARPSRTTTTAVALRTEAVLRFSPLMSRAAESGKSSLMLPSFAADSVASFSVPTPSSSGATEKTSEPKLIPTTSSL
jgi:hypothetical protein